MGLTTYQNLEAEHYYTGKRERAFQKTHYYDDDLGFVARQPKFVITVKYTPRRTVVRRTVHRQRSEGIRSSVASGDGNNGSEPEPEPEPERPQQYCLPHLHLKHFYTSDYLRARALYSHRVKN